jgi:acetate---CoA ligase (ADP-forming)
MGDQSPLAADCATLIRQSGVPFLRSPDRALRAMARVATFGRALAAPRVARVPIAGLPLPAAGIVPEYRAKELISALGIATPLSIMAHNANEARQAAGRIGYPVVLKAQAAALPHKSDAGGVIAGIADEAALVTAWQKLQTDVRNARPDVVLDGVLVEAMAKRGTELLLGARRDEDWEPVLVVGLGGVWAEALGDVQLLPADASEEEIIAALKALKGARLLLGFRGMPPIDFAAVARAATVLGGLVRGAPAIAEIEINPLMVYDHGAMALDALMVVTPTS